MKRSAVSALALAILTAGIFGQAALGGPGAPGGARGGGRGGPVQAGPPAPVPPQVAMARPTPAEVAQINDAVKKMIAADTSPTKALLEKYQSLLTVQVPRANPCIAPVGGGVRGPRHQAFVDRAKQGDIDLLLLGDSITDWWQSAPPQGGSAMLKKYFGDYKTADFAVAGDTTQGVLWGIQNGEGQGFQPKAIMLMIGTNNMGNCSAPEIAEGVGAIILECRKDFPNAKILLLAIFPRGNPTDPNRAKIAECNNIIKKLDDQQHVFYMDIGPKFLDPATGAFLPNTFRPDNLHPVEAGYEIWGEAVKDTLAGWLK
jgi:beta-glucosidase